MKTLNKGIIFLVSLLILGFAFGGEASGAEIKPILPNDIQISPLNDAYYWSDVAFDGTNYLVVWQRSGGGIRGQFVGPNGSLIDSAFDIYSGPRPASEVSVAFTGSGYLVVYSVNYLQVGYQFYGEVIVGQLVSPGGAVGPQIYIGYADNTRYSPDVATDGQNFMVVWQDFRSSSTNYGDIYGQLVSSLGSLIGGNFRISPAAQHQSYPIVDFGGSNYLVVWQNEVAPNTANWDVYGARVDTSGVVLDPDGIAISTAPGNQGASWGKMGVSSDGVNYLVVWNDFRGGGTRPEVYGARVSMAGELLDRPPDTGGIKISASGAGNFSVRAAFDGISWLVVYVGMKDNYPRLFGSRISPSGTVLDPGGTLLSEVLFPTILLGLAFDGSNYLVTWNISSPSGTTIYGQIVSSGANQSPSANAGIDQTIHVGNIVTLDGSGSSDPDGNIPLTYEWSFVSKPTGSTALFSDSKIVNPTFTTDLPGDYVLQLVVADNLGATSAPDTLTISTANSTPIAAAGLDQSVIVIGTIIQLDGTQSYDPDGDTIAYRWTFVSVPNGSTASLVGANTATPTFVADVQGDYVVQLVVSDPWTQSLPDTVTISFENLKPVANAGTSQLVEVGETVNLDGSGSSDANGDTLNYKWMLSSVPEGSLSVIANPTAMITSFVPNLPGTYVAQLIVNDGFVDSDPSTIQIQAVTSVTLVIESAQTAETKIVSLEPFVFQNENMQNALLNKLNAVIANIEAGNYEDALGQLQNDILAKTDGCVKSGAPDKNDWIKDCESQGIIYPYILDVISKVKELL